MGEPSILPTAFLSCMALEHEIISGLEREVGSQEVLTMADLGICLKAKKEIVKDTIAVVLRTFRSPVSAKCGDALRCRGEMRKALRGLDAHSPPSLHKAIYSCPTAASSTVIASTCAVRARRCSTRDIRTGIERSGTVCRICWGLRFLGGVNLCRRMVRRRTFVGEGMYSQRCYARRKSLIVCNVMHEGRQKWMMVRKTLRKETGFMEV